MHHFLQLWPGKFLVYKPHTDEVTALKARGSLNYGTPCITKTDGNLLLTALSKSQHLMTYLIAWRSRCLRYPVSASMTLGLMSIFDKSAVNIDFLWATSIFLPPRRPFLPRGTGAESPNKCNDTREHISVHSTDITTCLYVHKHTFSLTFVSWPNCTIYFLCHISK